MSTGVAWKQWLIDKIVYCLISPSKNYMTFSLCVIFFVFFLIMLYLFQKLICRVSSIHSISVHLIKTKCSLIFAYNGGLANKVAIWYNTCSTLVQQIIRFNIYRNSISVLQQTTITKKFFLAYSVIRNESINH